MTTAERVRECGCPVWVEPCVHFDGQVLWLMDGVGAVRSHASTCERFPGSDWPASRRYAVALGPESGLGPCDVCDQGTFIEEQFTTTGSILRDARAEFDRRATQLLGREA
jgi:hypothetical protein